MVLDCYVFLSADITEFGYKKFWLDFDSKYSHIDGL